MRCKICNLEGDSPCSIFEEEEYLYRLKNCPNIPDDERPKRLSVEGFVRAAVTLNRQQELRKLRSEDPEVDRVVTLLVSKGFQVS